MRNRQWIVNRDDREHNHGFNDADLFEPVGCAGLKYTACPYASSLHWPTRLACSGWSAMLAMTLPHSIVLFGCDQAIEVRDAECNCRGRCGRPRTRRGERWNKARKRHVPRKTDHLPGVIEFGIGVGGSRNTALAAGDRYCRERAAGEDSSGMVRVSHVAVPCSVLGSRQASLEHRRSRSPHHSF
jgi:hypothetical protein